VFVLDADGLSKYNPVSLKLDWSVNLKRCKYSFDEITWSICHHCAADSYRQQHNTHHQANIRSGTAWT